MKPPYELRVFHPDDSKPRFLMPCASAAEVVAAIPRLFEEHHGCERIEVYVVTVRLFTVDCHGKTTPG